MGLGFASPNIISHERNIPYVGLYRVKQLYSDVPGVRKRWVLMCPKEGQICAVMFLRVKDRFLEK